MLALLILASFTSLFPQEKRSLEVTDMMKFRQIRSPEISRDGKWVTLTAVPDRGDPEVQVHSADGKQQFLIPLARDPRISRDGKWVAAVRPLPAESALDPDAPGKEKEQPEGMILLETGTGILDSLQGITGFRFTNDSRWLLIHEVKDTAMEERIAKTAGSTLRLRSLKEATEQTFPWITRFAADSISRYLAMAVSDSSGRENGIRILDLDVPGGEPFTIWSDSGSWADNLTWNNRTGSLAFLAGTVNGKGKRETASLHLWEPGNATARRLVAHKKNGRAGEPSGAAAPSGPTAPEEGWELYPDNHLEWSLDGRRLFLGTKPSEEIVSDREERDSVFQLFDTEAILEDRDVDIWHWNDPYIIPNQKVRWKREKDRTYLAVYTPEDDRLVQLATPEVPEVRISGSSSTFLLASTNLPYAREMSWEGSLNDYYLVDLATGERHLAVERHEHTVSLSPDGKFLVWFSEGDWFMTACATLGTRNLTSELEVPFADEDWDFPADPPGYRTGGWVEGSGSVLIYDKYDIWQFSTSGKDPVCLTGGEGRREKYSFRIVRLDRELPYYEEGEQVWLSASHELKKHTVLTSISVGKEAIPSLEEEPFTFTLLAKAGDAGRLLFTRESYTEFPDLWVAGPRLRDPLRLTDINPQTSEFAWGTAELVEWASADGTPLQGVLIKPGNYEPGKRYPVLVYYYRIFSDRLHEFNEVVVNHRPCFPFYASNGYAVFLPDIRFDVGTPGYSATKCLVPGVQKIIDMGIADPEAIALHGHSWSGYQTAFVITQTNLFACAIAGAPVSNMTSAYSGIRWESGLARQFQYEQSQSRIGASLWEARDKYIENSPVFFADRIETPLLIQFGDQDGAVPWYQGIELYLAMRRLGKQCVFLQYRGEPHHLKKYPNKLDYTLKFKAYLDHYLKGAAAPEWLESGIPYRGE